MAKRHASTSPFAHLASANAEDEDDKNKPDAKAEGEDKEDDDEDEGDEKDTKSNRSKAKKAKADDDGGSDDDDDEENDDQAKAARSRERARCAAIFAAPSAARNLQAAAHLAFNTNLPRSQAVGLLNSLTPAPQANSGKTEAKSLRDRMQESPFAGVKQEASAASAPARPGAALVAAQNARGK